MKNKPLILAAILLPLVLLGWSLLSLDEPDFEVLESTDNFELRRYAPFMVAETRVGGDFASASTGFDPLVAYVRGHNYGGRKLPIIAPAMQQQVAEDPAEWLLGFVMAKEYQPSMLPRPGDPKVVLRKIPARLVAARRYRGNWGEARFQAKAQALTAALAGAGRVAVGAPIFARYNAPFVPGLLRRNEVMLEVEAPGP